MFLGNERILVVDDDPLTSKTFARGLSKFGYDCVTAGSADDADLALEQQKFDLMLLDIGMPGKNGLQYLPELTRRYPDMAILMVTGYEDRSIAVLAMQEGAYDFLAKPVELQLLNLRVEKALSRRALHMQNQPYDESLERAIDELKRNLYENEAYQEKLEATIDELNLSLEESRRELATMNDFVQSHMPQEESTLEAY